MFIESIENAISWVPQKMLTVPNILILNLIIRIKLNSIWW